METNQTDLVNHPSHYTSESVTVTNTYEPIDFCCHFGFILGNAFKYLFRRKHKGTELQDLKKAEFYLKKAIDAYHSETFDYLCNAVKQARNDLKLRQMFEAFIKEKDFLTDFNFSISSLRKILAFTQKEIASLQH